MRRAIVGFAAALLVHHAAAAQHYVVSVECRVRTETLPSTTDQDTPRQPVEAVTREQQDAGSEPPPDVAARGEQLHAEHSNDPLRYRIEAVAREDEAFHTRVFIGPDTIELAGVLRRDDDGKIRIELKHVHSIDTGSRVPVADGVYEPILTERAFQTSLAVQLDVPIVAGGMETETTDLPKSDPPLRSRTQTHMIVKVSPWTTP